MQEAPSGLFKIVLANAKLIVRFEAESITVGVQTFMLVHCSSACGYGARIPGS